MTRSTRTIREHNMNAESRRLEEAGEGYVELNKPRLR